MTDAGVSGEGTQSAKALPPNNPAIDNATSQNLVMCSRQHDLRPETYNDHTALIGRQAEEKCRLIAGKKAGGTSVFSRIPSRIWASVSLLAVVYAAITRKRQANRH